MVKNSPANAGGAGGAGWIPGSGIQRIRAWQPTSSTLAWRTPWTEEPGEPHGRRSLAGYSPWGHNESDMTELLTLSLSRRSLSNPPNL